VCVEFARQPRGDTQQLPGHVRAVGFDHDCDRRRSAVVPGGHRRADDAFTFRVVQRAAFGEQHERVMYLLGERCVGSQVLGACHGHDLHRPHRGRQCLDAPRARSEIAGRDAPDAVRRYCHAAGWIDLDRLAQPFRARQDGGQHHFGLHPAVVVLAAGIDPRAFDREVTDTGQERQVEKLGQLGTDLAGVGID
jgi:hypothetical protein